LSTYEIALFFHILGVLIFVAGIVVAGVAFEAARRREQPAEVALLLGLSRVGAVMVMAGGVMVPAFGLWLVSVTGVGYGAGWIQAALILYVIVLILGGFGGQAPKRARRHARALAKAGAAGDAQLRSLLGDRRSLAANYASALLVLAILALMIFQP
jgi:uncharacterized membrane protein